MPSDQVRKIVSAVTGLILTAVIGYACIFNSFTLTRIVLPFLSSWSGIGMRAEYLDYVPFTGRTTGRNISIGPESHPWFRAEEVHFTFDLSASFREKYRFYDVWIRKGDIQVCQYETGWSFGPPPEPEPELTALPESGADSAVSAAAAPEEDYGLELRRITLQDSSFKIRWGERRKNGTFAISSVNGYAERFKGGRPFNGRLSGKVQLTGHENNRIDKGVVNMSWHNRLTAGLLPGRSIWKLRLQNLAGRVNGEPFDDAALSVDFTGRQKNGFFAAEQLDLIQTRNGEVRSRLDFRGNFTPQLGVAGGEVRNGKLSPELIALASELFYDIDPGMVWVDYEGNFFWDQHRFNATGKFNIRREGDMRIEYRRLPFPAMTFDGKYDFRVDKKNREIDLAEFRLRALSQGRQTASLLLRKPLKYRWEENGKDASPGQRAVFDLNCNGLDIHLLKFLLPQKDRFFIHSGQIFSKITFLCHNDLKAVDISGSGSIRQLTWEAEQHYRHLEELALSFQGTLDKTFSFKLPQCQLEFREQNTPLGKLLLSGNWDHPAGKSFFTVELQNLSPELLKWYRQKPLDPALKALHPDPASLKFKGYFDAEGNVLNISGLSAENTFGGKLKLQLTAEPFTCDLTEDRMLENVKFNLSAAGPAAVLTDWAAGNDLPLPASGNLDCSVSGILAKDLSWLLFDGTLFLRALTCRSPWQQMSDVDAEGRFSCYFHNMENLEFKKADLYIRRQNHPALRIECPGTLDIVGGNYLGDWKLRYLNERFLNMFFPENKTNIDLNGTLQLTLSDHFQKQKLVAALDCSKWLFPDHPAVSGSLSGVLENTPQYLSLPRLSLELDQKETPLVHFSGSGKRPHNAVSGNETEIRLSSNQLDLPRVMALVNVFQKPSPAKKSEPVKASLPGRPAKPRLDLSEYPGMIDLELKNCTAAPGLTASLKGSLQIDQNKLTSETFLLRLGKSDFTGSLILQNETDGITLQGNLKGGEVPLEFRPVTELLLGYPMKGLQGTVSNLDCRIFALDDGGEGGWLNSLNGSFNADFQDLRIPSDLSEGPFGRLLLFPIDVAAHAVGFLPNDLDNWKARFQQGNDQHYTSVGILCFDQGNVRLRSEAGKITVDYCRFLGPSVKRLSFEGNVELRDQQGVDLKARISAIGGQVLIPIAGTLSDPELNWRTVATDPALEVLRKIRNLKVIGMDHQHHDKDEPLIVVGDLPGSEFLKKAHQFLVRLFQ